ncbi:MAG: TIGR04255 family protein [Desulfomonilaceae bacterium]
MTNAEELSPDPRHPNSPLTEVVFEMRFPGETAVECKRHEIQSKIRSDYPHLLVPAARNGIHLALEPYRFEREDHSAGVMIALNRFSYYSRAYPGFTSFKNECLRLISVFHSVVTIERLNRVGLRHINIIPFVRNDDVLPLKHFLAFAEPMETFFGSELEYVANHVVFPLKNGNMTVRLEVVKDASRNQEAILLDLDHARTKDLTLHEIEGYLEVAHRASSDQFKRIITPRYYEYICGKEV